jgi:hypothetical protein
MHVHGDGFAYLCDWKNGTGMIHRIGVPPAGTGSLYNALDFTSIPIYPMALESYGTYLAIIGTVLLNNTAPQIKTGKSYLFLWDCVSDSFNDQIEIPSALVTAILNVNGDLWIWGAGANSGFQIYKYTGGSSVTLIYDSSTGASPPAGAVDSQNGRVFFGTYDDANTYDDAVIAAIGYQNPKLGNDAINFISNLGTNNVSSSMISALKCVDAATNRELPIAGYVTNTTTYGMAKPSLSAAKTSFFHSAPIVVGQKFKVRGLRITLTGPVASGVVVEPTIVFEDGADSKQFTAINNTNYSGQTTIHYKPMEIESFATAGANGINDFYLRLFFNGGTGTVGVALPIEIDIETLDD